MFRKLLFFIILLISVHSFAQKGGADVNDTIRVASYQEFNAPSVGALVFANVLKFNFTAELLNADKQKIRDITKYTQKPKKEDFSKYTQGGRGTTVVLLVTETIEDPGIYYVRVGVTVGGEVGGSASKDYTYMVIVDYPRVLAPISIRKNYYFAETEAIAFGTAEYTDQRAYSFQVLDNGAIVDSGRGSIIKLDKALNEKANVGKKLTVKGFYRGKQFKYKTMTSDSVFNTEWEFSVDKPSLDEFSGWKKTPDNEWLVSVYNSFSKSFLYIYLGVKPGGFVVVRPEATNISVRAEPEGFLKGSGYSTRKQGSFFYIDLDVNDDFIQQMQETEVAVKVTISFRTQFGESFKRDYYAVVIK